MRDWQWYSEEYRNHDRATDIISSDGGGKSDASQDEPLHVDVDEDAALADRSPSFIGDVVTGPHNLDLHSDSDPTTTTTTPHELLDHWGLDQSGAFACTYRLLHML